MFAVAARAAPPAEPHDAAVVHSSRLQVDFQLAAGSGRITGVEVWYTLDEGHAWQQGEVEFDKAPPAILTTPHEGLHGLYVIVRNGVAASAAPPRAGTPPQIWAFVDHTPPLVQIASVQRDADYARTRRLTIRYTAYDKHLLPQPITVDYAVEAEKQFRPIVAARPNSGRFDWDVPAGLHGRVRVRVLAEDRGGQSASAESARVDLDGMVADGGTGERRSTTSAPIDATKKLSQDAAFAAQTGETPVPQGLEMVADMALNRGATDAPRAAASEPAERPFARLVASDANRHDSAEVSALLAEGRLRQARGEWALAEQRFRDALSRSAAGGDARVGLAGVLYRQGRLSEAEQEYRMALKQEPRHAASMAGLAIVLAARSDYAAARDVLTTLTALRPKEPGVWTDLGDMQVLAGDRAAGRSAWLRARTLPGVPKELREQIERRLLIYPEQSLP